jgi:hypothetical protein
VHLHLGAKVDFRSPSSVQSYVYFGGPLDRYNRILPSIWSYFFGNMEANLNLTAHLKTMKQCTLFVPSLKIFWLFLHFETKKAPQYY